LLNQKHKIKKKMKTEDINKKLSEKFFHTCFIHDIYSQHFYKSVFCDFFHVTSSSICLLLRKLFQVLKIFTFLF
jgi:hypothetical protein